MNKKIYVDLDRPLGNTDKRHIQRGYEMIIPVKTDTGWKAPNSLKDYTCGFVFKKHLEAGKTVLVNSSGGWNYITSLDIIVNIYTK